MKKEGKIIVEGRVIGSLGYRSEGEIMIVNQNNRETTIKIIKNSNEVSFSDSEIKVYCK